MRRFIFLIILIFLAVRPCSAADVVIHDLTADASPTADDLVETENSPGGTPASRKVTLGNLPKAMTSTNLIDTANIAYLNQNEAIGASITWTLNGVIDVNGTLDMTDGVLLNYTLTDALIPDDITITPINSTTEGAIESAIELQELQGAVTDGQVPNNITVDLATAATTASNLAADGVDALTEISQGIKSAADDTSKIVVGTAGSTNELAKWDSNGALVDANLILGTLTDGRICSYTSSGTLIDCNLTCTDITGSASLCDGSDDGGVGGAGDVTDIGNCSSGACFGGATGSTLTSTTDEMIDMGTANTFIYKRNDSGTVTFMGADNTGPADTIYDTASTGAITVGSADVTSVTIVTDSSGTAEFVVPNDSITLATETTGNYANGDGEAGNALAGDSATAFFTTGQIERARGGTAADTSAYGAGLLGSDGSNNTIDVDTEGELETALGGIDIVAVTTDDITSANLATALSNETGSGVVVFGTNPTISMATGSLLLPSSTSLPGTCSVGQVYVDTDATSGQRVYICETTNSWVVNSGGGGGGSGDITSVGDVTSGAAFDGTQGTILTFNNAGGDATVAYDGTDIAVSKPMTVTGTIEAGAFVSTGGSDSILSSSGSFSIGGAENTNNETLHWNFESIANTVTVSSVSGVTNIIYSSIDLNTPNLSLGSAGVKISGDGDGAITFLGLGNGTDEDLTLNLDDTSNTGVFTSSTSLATLNFSSIALQESGISVLNNDEIDASSELIAIMDDETGTGALVFATSPTLVTPALGTIASGVGTALTALNGENIQDDTIDDDSIDFADITGADLTLTDAGAITASGKIIGNASLDVKNGATSSGVLAIYEDSDAGTNFASFQVPSLAGNTVYTLPADDGDAGEQLQTDGSGGLTWEAAGSGGSGDVTDVGNCSTGACFTGASGTTFASNTDLIMDLDEDNNGTETFQVRNGGNTIVFEVNEFGLISEFSGGILGDSEVIAFDNVNVFGSGNDLTVDGTLVPTQLTPPSAFAGRSLTASANLINADAELYTFTKTIWFENPTASDDFKTIAIGDTAFTITAISCESDQTVNFDLQVDDGSATGVNGSDIACTTFATDSSLAGDTTVAAGDRVDLAIASVSGTPTWVSITFTATKDD